MRKHKKLAAIVAACAVSAVMACTALAPCASATEAETIGQDPATIEQYNLANENWDELLGLEESAAEEVSSAVEEVSSAPEEGLAGWAGSKTSDGGMSKLLIIAIIAFALGGIGVTFFIYSQFIYKAKLRRKLAEKEAAEALKEDFNLDGPVQLDFTDYRKEELKKTEPMPKPTLPQEKTHTQKVNDFFAEFERETKLSSTPKNTPTAPKKPAPPTTPTSLSREDEKKLNSVDWDDFFKNN